MTRQNIQNSLDQVVAGSAYLRERIASGEMGLIGAYYDIGTGAVEFGHPVTPDTFDDADALVD